MRILDRQRLQAYYKNLPGGGTSNPQLVQDLKDTQEQLNLILNKWNWDGRNPQSAHEFLGKFAPWVDSQMGLNKEVNELLKKHKLNNLAEIRTVNSEGGSEETEELITERDELKRDKTTLEQEVLAINNRLNLKTQEVKNKEKNLERLKREKNQLELQQQKALKEKNTLITTLNLEIKQQKEKVIDYLKELKTLPEIPPEKNNNNFGSGFDEDLYS